MFLEAIQSFTNRQKYPTFQVKAVFFDMDGVLFDSMKFHAEAWVKALTEVQIPFSHHEAYLNEGRTSSSTIDGAFLKHKSRTATEDEKNVIYGRKTVHFEALGKTETIPYAQELLQKVKQQGPQIFLVTGSGQLTLIDNLEFHFPHIFTTDRMVTAFDVIHGKPHPEPYLKALRKSGVQPWEAVVIENAPLGIESAVAAGLFTIAVNTGPLSAKTLYDSGAHIVLDGGVKELFEKWDEFISVKF